MYTPVDIQQKKFKGGMGYKKKDVDAFMTNLLESYEYLYKENIELNEKIRTLTNSLTQYKSIEKSLQKALILAQSAADDVKQSANASAKIIEDEAKSRARDIVLEARKDYDDIQGKAIAMARQLEVFKTQCRQAAMAQIDLLNGDLYTIDFEKLEKNMLESEKESLSFIEKKQEEIAIEKNNVKLDEKTEKILEAANKAAEADPSLKAAPTAEEIAEAKGETTIKEEVKPEITPEASAEVKAVENAVPEKTVEPENVYVAPIPEEPVQPENVYVAPVAGVTHSYYDDANNTPEESNYAAATDEGTSVLEEMTDAEDEFEDLEVDDEFYSLVAEVMDEDEDDDEDIQF